MLFFNRLQNDYPKDIDQQRQFQREAHTPTTAAPNIHRQKDDSGFLECIVDTK